MVCRIQSSTTNSFDLYILRRKMTTCCLQEREKKAPVITRTGACMHRRCQGVFEMLGPQSQINSTKNIHSNSKITLPNAHTVQCHVCWSPNWRPSVRNLGHYSGCDFLRCMYSRGMTEAETLQTSHNCYLSYFITWTSTKMTSDFTVKVDVSIAKFGWKASSYFQDLGRVISNRVYCMWLN